MTQKLKVDSHESISHSSTTFQTNDHWVEEQRQYKDILGSVSCYQDVAGLFPLSVLGQDTEPQTAPDVVVGTAISVWMYVWITVSTLWTKASATFI